MRALIKRDAVPSYELVSVEVPNPQDGETLLLIGRVLAFVTKVNSTEQVGICGSDIGLYKWDEVGQSIASLPFTPGHEGILSD